MNRVTSNGGFTLMEIVMVVGLFAFLGVMLAAGNFDMYRGFAFREERNTLVAALEKARSESMHNVCFGSGCVNGASHGISLVNGAYVIFQGISYAARNQAEDEQVPANTNIVKSGLTEIVFAQLSGDANASGAIHLTDKLHTAQILINNEGRISW